jgi:hypothetical protein
MFLCGVILRIDVILHRRMRPFVTGWTSAVLGIHVMER